MKTCNRRSLVRKLIFLSITLVSFGILNCSQKERSLPEERILLIKKDQKDRERKSVVTGRIPGEDIFLTINKFDTAGHLQQTYGAKPYGEKFKSVFNYDPEGRIIEEVVYHFSGGQDFENYKSGYELYSLSDTLADFENVKSKTKIVYEYRGDLTRQIEYLILLDTTGEILSDTTYQSANRND